MSFRMVKASMFLCEWWVTASELILQLESSQSGKVRMFLCEWWDSAIEFILQLESRHSGQGKSFQYLGKKVKVKILKKPGGRFLVFCYRWCNL